MKLISVHQSQPNLSLKPLISLSKLRISCTTPTNSGSPSIVAVNDFCALRSDCGTKIPYQDSGSPPRTGFFFSCVDGGSSLVSNSRSIGAGFVTSLSDDDVRCSMLPVSIPDPFPASVWLRSTSGMVDTW